MKLNDGYDFEPVYSKELKYVAEVFHFDTYMGIILQHKNGKWASSWNEVFSNEDRFTFETLEEALKSLR